jgi:hypothetical protein
VVRHCWIMIAVVFFSIFSACDKSGDAANDAGDTDGTDIDIDADTDTDTDVSDVTVEVSPRVSTVLIVKWRQNAQTGSVRLKFTFENGEYLESPKKPGKIGEHREVVLGVPSETEVTFYVVNENGGEEVDSQAYTGTTGSLPGEMPRPTLLTYEPSLAGSDRWNLGSVENTKSASSYYSSAYWIYILDRQARIVWYFKDPFDSRILFPLVSPDGTHITYDTSDYTGEGQVSSIHRATLDLEYEEEIEMDDMNWCYAETLDGKIIYNTVGNESRGWGGWYMPLTLYERQPDGTVRQIWESGTWADSLGISEECYSNTINWDPVRDTVLLSMPYLNTVLEIERDSGNLRSQWGDAPGSWDFDPIGAGLEFNHYPTITKDGTLLVSSHIPGGDQPGDHRIMEFEIDEENLVLRELWTYGEGIDDWPMYSGEASRMDNGNTLINYGTGGSIREVTPGKETAWHVLWDADFPDEEDNFLCGHNIFVNDLYALNRGPEE